MNAATLKVFVLKCPNCMAPTEEGSTHCRYCAVPLHWEPISPMDRDDFHLKYPETPADLKGKCVLGFGPTSVGAGETQVIQMMPQISIRPFRLYIPRNYAEAFMVQDFRIGIRSQMAGSNPIPAVKFSEHEVGLSMQMDTAMIGQLITVHVSNITTQVRMICGALDCHTIETPRTMFPRRETPTHPTDHWEYEAWKRRQR